MSSIISCAMAHSELPLEEIKVQVTTVLYSFLEFAKDMKCVLAKHKDFEFSSGSHYLCLIKKISRDDIDDGVAYALETWMNNNGFHRFNYENIDGYIYRLEEIITYIHDFTHDELNSILHYYADGRIEREYYDGRIVTLRKAD